MSRVVCTDVNCSAMNTHKSQYYGNVRLELTNHFNSSCYLTRSSFKELAIQMSTTKIAPLKIILI